jgi:hypothetical protein
VQRLRWKGLALTRYARPTLEQERALAPPGWVGGRLSEALGSLGPSQEFVTRVGRPVQATTSADWVACEDPPAEQWPARADEVRLASYHDCQSPCTVSAVGGAAPVPGPYMVR